MKKLDKKKQMYIIAIFSLALVIGIGYAILNSTLNITGNTKIKENSWDVHFENFQPTTGSVTATSAGIDTNKTSVNYTVTLSKPGDYYEFTVDAVNKGSIDAMINTVSNTGLTAAQQNFMSYSATYEDGVAIAEKQKLVATTGKETIKVRVEYKKDVRASQLPTTNQTVSLTFSVNYVQADENAIVVPHPVCKRATTLHTETCSRTDSSGCKAVSGDSSTITYGSLGTIGILTAGDAFDCDVNGDGTYDAATERFYYVSDLYANSNYVVLAYYNNVSGGSPNNTSTYAYDASISSSDSNYNGPRTAKLQLPTTAQWKNVNLSSTTRNIKNEMGSIAVSNFSYSGYAARLLEFYGEANDACGAYLDSGTVGLTDNCKYLVENTTYSNSAYKDYWVETVNRMSPICSYVITGSGRSAHSETVLTKYGVRPVIEVKKTDISY